MPTNCNGPALPSLVPDIISRYTYPNPLDFPETVLCCPINALGLRHLVSSFCCLVMFRIPRAQTQAEDFQISSHLPRLFPLQLPSW